MTLYRELGTVKPQQESIKIINTSHHHANVLTLCSLLYFSHMHTFVHTETQQYRHTHTDKHTYTYKRTPIHTRKHTRKHTYRRTYLRKTMHSFIYKHRTTDWSEREVTSWSTWLTGVRKHAKAGLGRMSWEIFLWEARLEIEHCMCGLLRVLWFVCSRDNVRHDPKGARKNLDMSSD